jgi:hypothetical protein
MRKTNLFKAAVVGIFSTIAVVGFLLTPKSETQTLKSVKTPEKKIEGKSEVAGYKNWTKVNDKPQLIFRDFAGLCRAPTKMNEKMAASIHNDKYIVVYVNSTGKDEMLTKKNPVFPVGTVVVKEKLSLDDQQTPELLTVMIKREKGFNSEVGDWEFMTLDGQASEVTSKGKLENCQSCHIGYKETDFITRTYLPEIIRQRLQ